MEHVSFEEETSVARTTVTDSSNGESVLSRLVISWGFAKTEKDAQKVLLFIAVICIILAIFFCSIAFFPPHQSVPQSVLDANSAKLLRNAAQSQ